MRDQNNKVASGLQQCKDILELLIHVNDCKVVEYKVGDALIKEYNVELCPRHEVFFVLLSNVAIRFDALP